MGKSKKSKGDEETSSGKPQTVKLVGLAVAFAVVGAVIGPKLLGTGSAAATEEPTTTTTEAGPVIVLDKITLNLSDGHLLQVGLALEMAPGHGGGSDGHGGSTDDDPTKGFAKAIDAAIGVLGDQSVASLTAPGGRDAAKAALTEVLSELYHGEVTGVYFHTFVMQ